MTAPVLARLDPPTVQVDGPDVTLRVVGAGFAPDAVIVFNAGDEVTVNVSDAEVTTIVSPATASGPISVPVAVRNGAEVSAPLTFTFTDAVPATPYVTVDDVRSRLKGAAAALVVDEIYLARCTNAANALVDSHLGRGEPLRVRHRWGVEAPYPWPRVDPELPPQPVPYPPLTPPYPDAVWRAALGVAIRIYRFKDAESDVADTWGDPAALRIPRDPLAGYVDLLAPYRAPSAWAPA